MPTTPHMNLALPTVSVTAGPLYATQLNSALGVAGDGIDGHDHTSGKGVPVPPSGIDLSSSLTFQNNDAVNLRSTRFYSQSTAFTDATDIGCCYVLDADLYYIDTAGNSIRITENGAISSASFGGITGLAAPATAAFSVDTFTFKSDTNEYAVMDTGDIRTRRSGETSPNYVGIQSPAALAASYQLTLPAALPAATSFATVSAAGAVATSISTSQGITKSMQAAVGQQISTSTGTFVDNETTYTAVTNANVTITTTGRPVLVFCKPVDGGSGGGFTTLCTGSDAYFYWRISVTGSATTTIGETFIRTDDDFAVSGTQLPASVVYTMYAASAGTYTLTLEMKKSGANSTSYVARSVQLVAVEM